MRYSPTLRATSPATYGCGRVESSFNPWPAALVEVARPGPHEGGAAPSGVLDRDRVPPPGHVVEDGPILERFSRLERHRPTRVLGAEGILGVNVADVVLTPALDVLPGELACVDRIRADELDRLVTHGLEP